MSVAGMGEDRFAANLGFVNIRLGNVEQDMRDMREAMQALVQLSERQASAMEKITALTTKVDSQDSRIRAIEIKQPGLIETRGWVISFISAILASLLSIFVSRATLAYEGPSSVQEPPAVSTQDVRDGAHGNTR